MLHRTRDHATEHSDDPLTLARGASVVGTWVWSGARGDHVLDRGAAEMLTGDPALAQTTLSLETVIARIHSEDRADVLRHVEKAEAEGGPVILTYRVHTAEGIRWVLDHGRIYAREAAMPAHGHGILIDVTARVLRDGRLEDPQAASSSPLDRAASHALAARRAIDEDGTPILRQLVDLLMWELGRAIARRIGGGHGNRLN